MAVQAISNSPVAVSILQNIALMAGLAIAQSGQEGMIFMLMASTKVGIIASVTGDASAAMPTVDRLVGCLQRASALRIDVAGATAVSALVMDGGNIMGVGSDIALVVTRSTFCAGGDLARGNMVDSAMSGLVIVMTNNTGGVNSTGLAIAYGIDNRGLQGQIGGVGLSRGVIAMAEVAGVARHSAMECVYISL